MGVSHSSPFPYFASMIRTRFFRTWILTTEGIMEPPARLAEECKKSGIEEGAFTICDIGETLLF